MSKRSEKFTPLAKAGKGITLCASNAQDEYFLVRTNGSADKIPLQKACLLYQQAQLKGELLWGKHIKKARAAKGKKRDPGACGSDWRNQMLRKLELSD